MIDVKFTSAFAVPRNSDVLVVTVFDEGKLGVKATAKDEAWQGLISRAIADDPKFTGKKGQTMVITPSIAGGYKKIVLLGAGKPEVLDASAWRSLGGSMIKALKDMGYESAEVLMEPTGHDIHPEENAAHLANGALLGSYSFDKYKTPEPDSPPKLNRLTIATYRTAEAMEKFAPMRAVAEGTFAAADVANEPGNVIYPESYAQHIKEKLEPLGVKVTILDEKDMAKLGMNAILAVGKGSAKPPRLVVMEYDGTGGQETEIELALAGKGVTFDTGGISLKPGEGMEDMKFDMGGSAAVFGEMLALARRGAKVKVVGAVGLAENMPSDRALKPGDIVKTMNGKTVEVINTDAEGRLVLCDVVEYVQQTYKPRRMIDLATLTGACVGALGLDTAGLFSNDDELRGQIEQTAVDSGEKVWRLPLGEAFSEATKSEVADLRNLGKTRYGGASTAAAFIEFFVHEGVKWAHIDMAGPGIPKDKVSKGWGVQLLDRFIRKFIEGKPPAPAPVVAPRLEP